MNTVPQRWRTDDRSRKDAHNPMMLIECPECGPRNENEFHYGGEAHIAYPADGGAASSDSEWAQYLFYRASPKGLFAERWVHSAGCRRWFNAVRDTVSYQIVAVYRSGEPRPAAGGSR
jgi:sarcosine oxidase subunit delta